MAGSRALVVSVLAHGAALGVIAWWFDEHEVPPAPEVEAAVSIEVVAPVPEPAPAASEIEVAMLDEAQRAPASAPVTPRISTRGASPRTGASTAETTAGPSVPAAEPARRSELSMRGRRHDLSLSEAAAARSLGPDRPREERAKPTGKIAPAGGEGVIDDAVAKFRVHGDGTVDIADKEDIDWEWRVPIPTPKRILKSAKAIGEDIAAWYEDPYRDTRVGKTQDLPRHIQAVPGLCEDYGDGMCDAVDPGTGKRPKLPVERSLSGDGLIIPIIGGKTDITAYLHRKFVGDPFASRKLKLLDDTRAERAESGTAFRAKQLEKSAELMANNLASLWAATTDPAARREALFELWDECVEGEGAAGEAGERARVMVLGWIGARLPRGAEGAFSDDDIARFDRKRASRQHFAPYER
jgi:hypothetical protein